MGNHSLKERPKFDRLLGIKLEDTGEQLSGSPHTFVHRCSVVMKVSVPKERKVVVYVGLFF